MSSAESGDQHEQSLEYGYEPMTAVQPPEQVDERNELLKNGCEQALLLLERKRFEDDPECKVVRAVLRSALRQ